MVWKLTLLQFRGMFSRTTLRGKGRAMPLVTAALFLYLGCVIVGMMLLQFSALCAPFVQLGLDWFYFALAGILALSAAFICTLFSAQSQLYEAKDNELLLSLPIRPGDVLASRMLLLWLLDFLLTMLILIPAGIVYALEAGIDWLQIAALLLLCLTLPCLSLSLIALAVWGTAALTCRIGRWKTVLTVAFTCCFLAAYLYLVSQMQTILTQLIAQADKLAAGMQRISPLYHLGLAFLGRPASLFGVLLVCLSALAATWWFLSRSFLVIATRRQTQKRTSKRHRAANTHSPAHALLTRELRRLGSSSGYLMNSGVGVIMLVLATAAAIWQRPTLLGLLASMPISGGILAAAAVCFISSTICFTAPSVSLEGKTLWLLQSLPVSPQAVLQAKLRLHLLITLPTAALCWPALCWALEVSAVQWIPGLALCLTFNWYAACMGLTMNLLFPKLDWIHELAAVKQGISVLFSMLAGFSGAALPILGIGLEIPAVPLLVGLSTLFAAVSLLLTCWLRTKGAVRFAGL